MKLTLRQRNSRAFTVLSEKKDYHVHDLPREQGWARDRIWRILDETRPTQRPEAFADESSSALTSLLQGLRENRPTSFYCGDVCLTLR